MHGQSAGYTLIELVVVVAMLGMLMGFAAPRVAEQIYTSEMDEVELWLNTTTTGMREKAQLSQATLVLRVDVGGQQFFIETEDAASTETETESKAALILPERLSLSQVLLGQDSLPANNQAPIRFFPDGAADPALLHITDNDGQRFTWIIEPFLVDIVKMEEHGQYEAYWQ